MKLHTKLSLSILVGLIIIVAIAQLIQSNKATQLISNLSEETLRIFREREEQAIRNLFFSVERSVAGSLERGEMEKFTKLLEAQKEVVGLLEFSLYNAEGVITHSSDPAFLKKSLDADLTKRLLTDETLFLRNFNDAIEIYQPKIVGQDCIRCHRTWKTGVICGVTSMRFSAEALAKAEQSTKISIKKAKTTFLTFSVFAIIGIIVIFMGAMYASVSQFVKRPLTKVIQGFQDISKGEGDLTQRLKITSQDELGWLAQLFNTFLGKLQEMVQLIQQSGIQIVSSATQLAATAREQEAIMATQVQSTDKVFQSVAEIAGVTDHLVDTMRGVAAMTETPEETSQTDLARMEQAMRHMEEASRTISQKLSIINEKAENITAVITTITKVADQTNLLSLNAAIEAEKAGEYGRGFTVVAREIRRLADQTAFATLDIGQMVKEMQTAVISGVKEMDNFIQDVQRNVTEVEHVSVKLASIVRQVQALAPNFEAVNVAMAHLREETQETKTSLDETYSAIEQLNEAARGLQTHVSRFKVS